MPPVVPNIFRSSLRNTVLILLALAACPGIAAAAGPGEQTVVYRGEISQASNQAFFRRVAGMPVKRLRITSGGGDVEAGIKLGYWVFNRRLDVEVEGACLSSCANYVFPAGAGKFIRPGGVVAWHGNYRHLQETGLWQDDIRHRMEKYGEHEATARRRALSRVNRLVHQEEVFFRRIMVNEYVCRVGKMPPYNVSNYYFLSAEDMARFGIDNVQTPEAYTTTDYSDLGVDIVYLKLSDSVSYLSSSE